LSGNPGLTYLLAYLLTTTAAATTTTTTTTTTTKTIIQLPGLCPGLPG